MWEGPLDGDYDFDEQAIDRKLHNRKKRIQIPEEAQHPELQDRKESESKEENLLPAVITRTPNRPERKAPHSPPVGPKPPPTAPRGAPSAPRGPARPQVGRGRPMGRARPIPGQSRPQPQPPITQPQPPPIETQESKMTEPVISQPSYTHNAAPQPHLEQVLQPTIDTQPPPPKPKLQIQSQPIIESTYEEKKDDSLLQLPLSQPQDQLYQLPIQQQQVIIQNPAPKIIHHVQEVIFGEISIPPEKKQIQPLVVQKQPQPPPQQKRPLQPLPQPQQPQQKPIMNKPIQQQQQRKEPPPIVETKDLNESGMVDGEPLISPFEPLPIHESKDSESKESHISPPPPMMKQQMKFTVYILLCIYRIIILQKAMNY